MNQTLKTALIQSDLVWENPEQNRHNFSNKINAIDQEVDLIVLPEMFTTGFSMKASVLAETMDAETVKWMQKMAAKKQAAIVGSLIMSQDSMYFNRLVFVHPSGKVETYNKRHTFTLAGEDKIYTAGAKKLIVSYKGWKICPLVCYDLRFPVWARNVENYDLLLYVANWPKRRIYAWDALLKARAIENMCYCIGLNRVGFDANNYEYNGNSAVYDVLGKKVSNIQPNLEQTEIVVLSKNHIDTSREKFQFLNDRDDFILN